MAADERPYEKCEKYGAAFLTDTELLAVLLRSGIQGENSIQLARRLLHPGFGEEGILTIHQWTLESLQKVKGIGKVRAVQVLCLSELAKRLSKASAAKGLDFSSPESIAAYYMEEMRHMKKEIIKLLCLNTKMRLLGECVLSTGTVDRALISPREIFTEALLRGAVSVILLHNHPSGDPSPSKDDIYITRRVSDAGRLLGIELLDHIVIGDNCYVSLREKGIINKK